MRRQGSIEIDRGEPASRVDAGIAAISTRHDATAGIGFVSSFRLSGRAFVLGTAAFAMLTGADAGRGALVAQGKLDARYTVTLAGLPIGRGAWVIDIGDDYFTASASGATSGLLQVFASGHGQSASRGSVVGGQPVPASFASHIVNNQKTDDVHVVISSGTVKEFRVDPPTATGPDRVPVTEAHRRGIADPMTASLMRVPGNGDPLAPPACQRTLAIFDGRMRYDLQLSFKRLDRVRSDQGYQGTAVVCAVRFAPIAGHVPDRAAIKYLVQLRDIEMWLAPIAGTRVMVPYRVSVPTPIGLGVMQATQFVSSPQPGKAAAKTQ
jgi:Protein of unknown function (DUF3108)